MVGLAVSHPERTQLLSVCERGFGKRTPLDDFRLQNRGGKGIILIDASDRNGPVVGIALVKEDDDLVLMTDQGQTLRTKVLGVRETGRNAQGVRLMNVADDERIVALETVAEREEGTGSSMVPPASLSSPPNDADQLDDGEDAADGEDGHGDDRADAEDAESDGDED